MEEIVSRLQSLADDVENNHVEDTDTVDKSACSGRIGDWIDDLS